jgi:hypothetical protein
LATVDEGTYRRLGFAGLDLSGTEVGSADPARAPDNGRVRIGNVEIRPLGGGLGCLLMIVVSILLSVLLTVGLNVLIR